MKTSMKRAITTLAIAIAIVLAACSSDEGAGSVTFTTYGEDFIEKQIPAEEFADGWTVTYTKFLVTLSGVAVAERDGSAPAASMTGARIFDMHAPGGKTVFSATNLPAKPYTHVSYVIAPAKADAVLGEGATEADKQMLTSNGYSVYVSGSMTKAAVTKTFEWGFETATVYDRCEGELSGKLTEGVVVTNGGTDAVEITIHGDHLFYDDLQSPEAKPRGDAIAAADANADGKVTLEELAAVELAALPPGAGTYGTGSAGGIENLRTFVEALTRTVGHFRGEGECFARPR